MEVKLEKRTQIESVAYLVGQYFLGNISLTMLKLHLDSLPKITDSME